MQRIMPSLAAATLTVMSACAASGDQVRSIEAHPYKVDSSFDAASDFFMNDLVFEGVVTAVHDDRYVWDHLSNGGTFEAVYTPIMVEVTRVHSGIMQNGDEVVLRAMGGTAAGVRFESDTSPDKTSMTVGAKLLIFAPTPDQVDNEPGPATTPNFIYRSTSGRFVDITYASGPPNGNAPDSIDETTAEAALDT